jgi:hypothetical protein
LLYKKYGQPNSRTELRQFRAAYRNNFWFCRFPVTFKPYTACMKTKTGIILFHLFACFAFLALPVLFAPGSRISLDQLYTRHIQREIFGYLLMILFFYLNYFILIPKLYFPKKYAVFFVLLATCLFLVTFLPQLLYPMGRMHPPMPPPVPGKNSILFEISHHFFLFLVVVFISLTLKISNQWKQTQKEKLTAELSYLKAQINPHFLFNTLNSIYALAIEKSDQTPTAVVKLSGMMRYVLSESQQDFVPLEKEISYISDYIELQKIRLGATVNLTYTVTGNLLGKQLAPLILISFVENAFKYGVNPEEPSRILIEIAVTVADLTLLVKNNKVNTNIGEAEKSGLGIQNTRNRLQLLYPGRYDLGINDAENEFTVTLKIAMS